MSSPDPNFRKIVTDDLKSYVNMRISAVKLDIVEKLSTVSGNTIRYIVCGFTVLFMLVFLLVALISWLSALLGSLTWAALAIAGFFLLLTILLFALRKVFVNGMVGRFSRLFFNSDTYKDEQE